MRKLLIVLVLLCGVSVAQTISAVRVLGSTCTAGADACNGNVAEIDIANLAVGGTYNFGFSPSTAGASVDGAATVKFTVTSLGYDATGSATTISRAVYATTYVRKPYPNNAAKDESVVSTTLTVRVMLSETIYASDTITVTIASGFYTNGSASTAVSNLSVTNQSTLAYPKVIARWAWVPYERIAGSTFLLEAVAFHKFAQNGKPLAAVVFSCVDQHSNTVSQTVNDMTVSTRTGDVHKVLVYAATISASTLTQGDVVTCNFKAYPWVGSTAALADSSAGAAMPTEVLTSFPLLNDKTGAMGRAYAIVASTGHASTATTWMTTTQAAAESAYTTSNLNSYSDIGFAVQACKAFNNATYTRNNPGGCVIELESQNYTWPGSASGVDLGAMTEWLIVQPATGTSPVINAGTNSTMNVRLIKVVGVSVTTSGVAVFGGNGTTDVLWLHGNTLNMNDTAPVFGHRLDYATQNVVTNLANGFQNFSSTYDSWGLVRGNNYNVSSPGSGLNADLYAVIGNSNIAGSAVESTDLAGKPFSDNAIFAFNSLYNTDSGNMKVYGPDVATTIGMAVVQNVIEQTATSGNPIAGFFADSSTSTPVLNTLEWHNTFRGERTNIAYDESSAACTTSHIRKDWSIKYNAFDNQNIAGTDVDATHGCTANGARIGNWSVLNMVGAAGNVLELSSGATYFPPEYLGLYTQQTTTLGFVNDQSTNAGGYTGGGLGNGNYHLTSSSGFRNVIPAGKAVLPYDLDGIPRSNAGTGAVGAYEFAVLPSLRFLGKTRIMGKIVVK